MKLAIVGSRDLSPTITQLAQWIDKSFNPDWINLELVSGGARGVDKVAEDLADAEGIKIKVFYPDWDQHGKAAGPIRNQQIVEYADVVLAIWDGKSKGTLNTIKLTKKLNKQCIVINPDNERNYQ